MRFLLVITGLLILILTEILRVYFIMPFPGSQYQESIEFAYLTGKYILAVRLFILLLIAFPLYNILSSDTKVKRIATGILILIYGTVFYLFNFRFMADTMFYQPELVRFLNIKDNRIHSEKLVLGIEINGEAKAYPLQIIGYHHQVRDSVGGTPVMVTYCTVCRTGRVFSPFINGKNESFRLVGMDHFNAMFEDATTKSWWRQVSGEAIAGPLKGQTLPEIPSRQMRLSSWFELYPEGKVLQQDSTFRKEYDDLDKYDLGTLKSSLEKRDSLSWKDKSWVVGIRKGTHAKAIDWNRLVKERVIQDSLPDYGFMVVIEKDLASFHSFETTLGDKHLRFVKKDFKGEILMMDENSGSVWNLRGTCISGALKGSVLRQATAYQEFWHSWKTFNPLTLR
jgi:hypothetical protein